MHKIWFYKGVHGTCCCFAAIVPREGLPLRASSTAVLHARHEHSSIDISCAYKNLAPVAGSTDTMSSVSPSAKVRLLASDDLHCT
jgi:hypothetical protein